MVRGTIPPQIDGTYYRAMPDAAWAPLYDDDVFINGDGAVDAVRIRAGHADFKQKFVRTEKFVIERAARRAVFGKYRNRYTDDPRVRHKIHSTANTHVIYFEKQLLALKEDSLPYAMDPDTLETKGMYHHAWLGGGGGKLVSYRFRLGVCRARRMDFEWVGWVVVVSVS